jgi:hypothetical protein
MPKPPLISPDKMKRIADQIALGNDPEAAARAAGISKSTHYAWLARGREASEHNTKWNNLTKTEQKKVVSAYLADKKLPEGKRRNLPDPRPQASEEIYLEYLDTIERAQAEAEIGHVLNITKAAREPRTWQAAAWLLTHGPAKSKWAAINKTEISGPDGTPVQVEETLTDPRGALAALLEEEAKKNGQKPI